MIFHCRDRLSRPPSFSSYQTVAGLPGFNPVDTYDGAIRRMYHLYNIHCDKFRFANAPRAKVLEALRKEGIPAAPGYSPLNKQGFVEETIRSRAFQSIYSTARLNEYQRRIACPLNDRLCERSCLALSIICCWDSPPIWIRSSKRFKRSKPMRLT